MYLEITLLDKVMSRNQWHIGVQEHHLMLKELHMRPYMVTKRRCVWNKTFLLGPIVWNKVISYFISPRFYIHQMTTKAGNGNRKCLILFLWYRLNFFVPHKLRYSAYCLRKSWSQSSVFLYFSHSCFIFSPNYSARFPKAQRAIYLYFAWKHSSCIFMVSPVL